MMKLCINLFLSLSIYFIFVFCEEDLIEQQTKNKQDELHEVSRLINIELHEMNGRQLLSSNINELSGGSNYLILDNFYLGTTIKDDFSYFMIGFTSGMIQETAALYREDGNAFGGPRADFTIDVSSDNDWDNKNPANVYFSENGIIFVDGYKRWCLGLSSKNQYGQYHLSLTAQYEYLHHDNYHYVEDRTAGIWVEDGLFDVGPRADFSCWEEGSIKNDVIIGKDGDKQYIQFNDKDLNKGIFRIGYSGDNQSGQRHLSIASYKGLTAAIFRSDGYGFEGPRSDFNWGTF